MGLGIAFRKQPRTSVGTVLADTPPLADRELMDGLMPLIQSRPQLKEALATRLADELNTSMYGRAIRDNVSPDTHPHATMYISPYARPAAGAAAFVTYTDRATGEVYVLLGLKKEGEFVPPGGYMEVHEPEGGNLNKPYDRNLMETSRRELEEETGLKIHPDYKPESLGACSEYGVTNDPRLQTVVEGFHYNLMGARDSLPKVEGRDDIAAAVWVKASDIHAHHTIDPQAKTGQQTHYTVQIEGRQVPIRDQYGAGVELAVANARSAMLGQCTHRMSARKLVFDPASKPLAPESHAAWQDTIARLGAIPIPQRSWAEMTAPAASSREQGGTTLH